MSIPAYIMTWMEVIDKVVFFLLTAIQQYPLIPVFLPNITKENNLFDLMEQQQHLTQMAVELFVIMQSYKYL